MSEPTARGLLDFTGQVVLVTGASRGLGRVVAARFAEAGALVALGYRAHEAGAREALRAIEEAGGCAALAGGDLGTLEGARAVVGRAVEAFGRLDVLVNNAGSYPVTPLLELDEEAWRRVLDDNLSSVAFATRAAAEAMLGQAARRAGEVGAVVNIASIEGLTPAPGHAHYASAKAAVLMHTRAAALELGPRGIRVNAVSPGLIDAPTLATDWPEGVARWRSRAPLGALVAPLAVADTCLFLASPAARAVTGASLVVDAGVSAAPMF